MTAPSLLLSHHTTQQAFFTPLTLREVWGGGGCFFIFIFYFLFFYFFNQAVAIFRRQAYPSHYTINTDQHPPATLRVAGNLNYLRTSYTITHRTLNTTFCLQYHIITTVFHERTQFYTI